MLDIKIHLINELKRAEMGSRLTLFVMTGPLAASARGARKKHIATTSTARRE